MNERPQVKANGPGNYSNLSSNHREEKEMEKGNGNSKALSYLYVQFSKDFLLASRAGVAQTGRLRQCRSTVPHTWSQVQVSPMLVSVQVLDQKRSAAILTVKKSAGVAQSWIWGIHCMRVRKHACEGSTLALKPRANITKKVHNRGTSDSKMTDVLQIFLNNKMCSWNTVKRLPTTA